MQYITEPHLRRVILFLSNIFLSLHKIFIMVFEIEKTTTEKKLKSFLESLRENRVKRKKPNLTEFFGVLPTIGDGLEFQKSARNEWD